jgi:hypothetical protein
MKRHYTLAMKALNQIETQESAFELEQLAEFLFHREY